MTDYPTASEYQEIVQHPEAVFTDPELKEAVPEEGTLGLPRAITGAFAVVFPVVVDGKKLAVRFFLSAMPDQHTRYRAISQFLKGHELPSIAGFEYQSKGVHVNGRILPLLKMEWIDGVPINRFIAENLDRPDVLKQLAGGWVALTDRLDEAGVAHGDFQHGNILVTYTSGKPEFRLIDLDTMYVPGFKAGKHSEIGHRNFQHPDRDTGTVGPAMDRFSGLVVLTALRACAVRPDLWDRYDTGENLLFGSEDFYDPQRSPLFRELAGIDDLKPYVEALRTACFLEPEDVPTPGEVEQGIIHPLRGKTLRTKRTRRAGRSEKRSPLEGAFLPGLLIAVVISSVLVAIGWWRVGVILAVISGILAVLGSWRRYRRLPEVRRRRRLQAEIELFERQINRLKREVERLKNEQEEVEGRIQSVRQDRLNALREDALERYLNARMIGEAVGFDGLTHKHIVRLKAAGIRSAYQVTPEKVARAREMGENSRQAVLRWRASLVEASKDSVPAKLPESEETRLQAIVAQRKEELKASIDRECKKQEVRLDETKEISQRLDNLPEIPYRRYLAYLLRIAPLPSKQGS